MAGPLATKLRLVRCPICRQVLPELPNIPMYKCGGCNTILQAKKCKNDTKDTDLQIPDVSMGKKNELERGSEYKEARSLSKEDKEARSLHGEETLSSTGELPLEKNNGSDGKEDKNSNMSQSGVTRYGNEESSSEAREEAEVDQDNCSLKQNNGRDPNEYVQCNEKQTGGVNFPDEVASPIELSLNSAQSEVEKSRNCFEEENGVVNFSEEVVSSTELYQLDSEESSPVAGAHSQVDESKNYLEQDSGRNQNEDGICNGKQTGCVNFSDEAASSTELNDNDTKESSPVVRAHSEASNKKTCLDEDDGRNQSAFGDFKRDWPRNTKFSNEVSSSTELTCQEIEESTFIIETNRKLAENSRSPISLDQSQKRRVIGFDRVSSVDTLENVAVSNYSSEFSLAHRDMPNFPTTSNYGYEGSVSSYDGNDDEVHDQYLNLLRKNVEAKPPIVKAVDKRDEVMNRITSYPEMEHQAWNCSSIPSENKHYTTKGKWHQDELMEPTRRGSPVRSRMKFESGGYRSRVPLYSSGSLVGYETGGPSNYRQEEFQCRSSIHSANKPENKPEEEKMELLKMVLELQHQLKRTCISKGVASEVEMCPRRCNQGKRCPHQYRTSRIPFSAEANISRYTKTELHSCFHCCPHDRQSAPLSPHVFCNKSHQYKVLQSPRYCNLYSSNPCSPQYGTSSEFSLQSYDANSDDRERKKYDRERNRLKRHIRPLAGGAPFVICYLCSELLQLPLDFLQSKRRFHKLRCSACSNTLKFSLEDGTCIHPYTDDYTPDAIAPPPSEVDDYGPSLGKSCSTEGEPSSVGPPFQAVKRNSYGRKMPSGSSFEPMGENSVEMFAAAGPSSKMSKAEKKSSEIEELRPVSVSPLHRLMGYTSPSEVMQR